MRDDVRGYLRDLILIVASAAAGLGAMWAARHFAGSGTTLVAGLVDCIVLAQWLWVMKKSAPGDRQGAGGASPLR